MGWLFERVAAAVSAQARREGREVRLVFSGEETAIDRRVAEQLVDPVLQLARNAVAHGIEPAPERAMRGKPRVGSVQLAAQPRSGGLRLVVQDDGAGVDVADVRRRAVARGTISPEIAGAADDQTLLSLLFVPGLHHARQRRPARRPRRRARPGARGRAPPGRHHPPREPARAWA